MSTNQASATAEAGGPAQSAMPTQTSEAQPSAASPGATGGKDAVTVTPDMITKFAQLIRDAVGPLSDSEAQLATLDSVQAGWFPDGEDIRKFIGSGRDGRVRDIMENAGTMRDQLNKVADKLDEVAHRYHSSEELNQHLVSDLAPVLGSFGSQMSGMNSGKGGSSTADTSTGRAPDGGTTSDSSPDRGEKPSPPDTSEG
jgi:hypothetical protein